VLGDGYNRFVKEKSIHQGEVKSIVDQLLRRRQFMISSNDTNVLFEIDRCDWEKKFGLQLALRRHCP
jgi:hypothetical protein